MQYLEFTAANAASGAALPFATATVFLSGTTTLAALFAANGSAIPNPAIATNAGLIGFALADGTYDILIVSADKSYIAPMWQSVQIVDVIALETQVTALASGGLTAGAVTCQTQSALFADLAHAAGTLGWVWGDSTPANNGLYAKLGASSSGSWTFTGIAVFSSVHLANLALDVLSYINGAALTYGQNPPVSGGTTVSGGNSFISKVALGQSGTLSQIQVYATAAGPATLFTCSVSGLTATLLQQTTVNLAIGLNTFTTWNPSVSVGQFVGLYSASSLLSYNTGGSAGYWSASGLISGSGTTVASGTQTLEIGATVVNGIAGEAFRAEGAEGVLSAQVAAITAASTINQGQQPPVGGTNGSTIGFTRFPATPISATGLLTNVTFYARAAGQVTVVTASLSGSTLSLQSAKTVTATIGVNTIAMNQPVQAGWLVGIYSAASVIPDYTSGSTGNTGYSVNGLVGASSSFATTANLLFQIGWTLVAGMQGEINFLLQQVGAASGTGIGLLGAADNTGVADSTAAFATALASYPDPQVPAGSFSLTAVPNSGLGLWGDGMPNVSGVQLLLPKRPELGSRWHRFRACLVSQIYSGLNRPGFAGGRWV